MPAGDPDRDRPGRKTPYVKPEVKKVPLTPEEAVLAGCKVQGTTGPGGQNCRQGGACVDQLS